LPGEGAGPDAGRDHDFCGPDGAGGRPEVLDEVAASADVEHLNSRAELDAELGGRRGDRSNESQWVAMRLVPLQDRAGV
jgi:hypothetical protein